MRKKKAKAALKPAEPAKPPETREPAETPETPGPEAREPGAGDSPRPLFNRELNWLEFNKKVLAEAANEDNPLLERVKFLAIFFTNLEEFFMVRVAGLTRQRKLGAGLISPDGLSVDEQLSGIRRRTLAALKEASNLWRRELKPALFAKGLKLIAYQNLSGKEKKQLGEYFQKEVYPILTPQALDKGRPFPQISSGSLNILVELSGEDGKTCLARLKIPDNLPRFIFLPAEGGDLGRRIPRPKSPTAKILPLEILISQRLTELFPGYGLNNSCGGTTCQVEIESTKK